MEIPKLKDISSSIRKMSVNQIYRNLITELAVHHSDSVLDFLVVYIEKTRADLSLEIVNIARKPNDLSNYVECARKLVDAQAKYESDHSFDVNIEKETDNSVKNEMIHLIKEIPAIGIDMVLVRQDGRPVVATSNDRAALASANWGIDSMKYELFTTHGSGHDFSGNSGDGLGNPT